MKKFVSTCVLVSLLTSQVHAQSSAEAGRAEIEQLKIELNAMLDDSNALKERAKKNPGELETQHQLYKTKLARLIELQGLHQALVLYKPTSSSEAAPAEKLAPMPIIPMSAQQRVNALLDLRDPYKILGISEKASDMEVLEGQSKLNEFLNAELTAAVQDSAYEDLLHMAKNRVGLAADLLLQEVAPYPKSVIRQFVMRVDGAASESMHEIANTMINALDEKDSSKASIFSDHAFLDKIRFMEDDMDRDAFEEKHGTKEGFDLWLAEVHESRKPGAKILPGLRSSNPTEFVNSMKTVADVSNLREVLREERTAADFLKKKNFDDSSTNHFRIEADGFLLWASTVYTTSAHTSLKFNPEFKKLLSSLESAFAGLDSAELLALMSESRARQVVLFADALDLAQDDATRRQMKVQLNEASNDFIFKVAGSLREERRIRIFERATEEMMKRLYPKTNSNHLSIRASTSEAFRLINAQLTVAASVKQVEQKNAVRTVKPARFNMKEWLWYRGLSYGLATGVISGIAALSSGGDPYMTAAAGAGGAIWARYTMKDPRGSIMRAIGTKLRESKERRANIRMCRDIFIEKGR